MATCHFCGQEFSNKQAVRAHLKACAAYLGNAPRQAVLPQGAAATLSGDHPATPVYDLPADAFDPVRQMRQSVAAEKLRLQLREIRDAHGEFDSREQARQRAITEAESRESQARQATEREREAVRVKAQSEAQARQRAEDAKHQLAARRREVIQDVKRTVIEHWFGRLSASAELKAQMLQAIEAALAPLAVQELPKAELVLIAETVRDRLNQAAIDTQRGIQALAEKKQLLQRYGNDYADQELKSVEDLEFSERWRIESRIRQELQDLTGQESRADVKAWVDDILDEEGLENADDEIE